MICSLMELAMATPITFLSGISFAHLMNYLVVARIQMYSFKGEWIGSARSSPKYGMLWDTHVLKIYRIYQELLVGFLSPLVFSI